MSPDKILMLVLGVIFIILLVIVIKRRASKS